MTPQNEKAIAGLEPPSVWQFFAGMASIPRPSRKEDRIRDHVRKTAEAKGLAVREDGVGNLVITAPASPGCENVPITVLQGHLDMVGEANRDVKHDFDNDPIEMVRDKSKTGEPIVRANGTTLGADNGIGVALAFAAATDPNVKRGPIEILLTIDEETGMTGAKGLEPDFIKGRRLINLDSEEDDAIYIGCAGGCDGALEWELDATPIVADLKAIRVHVLGLRGGHSGGEIHENRGSANKVLTRVLRRAGVPGIRLMAAEGGNKRNAIAREAYAIVAVPADGVETLKKTAEEICAKVAHESAEPDLKINIEDASADAPKSALTANDTRRVIAAFEAVPHGVLEMHPKIRDLVQTSNNMSTIATASLNGGDKMKVTVGTLSRSSVDSRLFATADQIGSVGDLAGAKTFIGNSYPGWEPNVDSPLLATTRRVYESVFKKEPHVLAIHAGLECGIIGQRVGEIDMVSFGPTITGAHSPDECVYINSVGRIWDYLKAVLEALTKS